MIGRETQTAYRQYQRAESVSDHSALLTRNARYKAVVGERDYKAACRAIKAAGYATDPDYAEKLIRVIEEYGLTAYDGIAAPDGTVFSVGDVVEFTGKVHYSNSKATAGKPCKPGAALITGIAVSGTHPVHLAAKPGGASNVYGWADLSDVRVLAVMRAGAKVRYYGSVYRDSDGNGKGRVVDGVFTVKYYGPQRTCGVHIDDFGWVSESDCVVIG